MSFNLSVILGSSGEKRLLLGNEAIARGALEGGISVATAYPGTPSTEILEALAKVAKKVGLYVEWSVNEKVALEVAIGASMCGLRAITCMKHVGLNVASDPFMSLGYTGVKGGLVIVSADDPNAHSSQNEQDNRLYGMHSYIPVIEPSSVHEAKELTRLAFDISENYEVAVLVRSTTRISHMRGKVVFGEIRGKKSRGNFHRDLSRWVLLPVNSRRLHEEAIRRVEKLALEAERWGLVEMIQGDDEVVVVTGGIAYAYVAEALNAIRMEKRPTVLKLSMTYPLPRKTIEEIFKSTRRIVVIEELEPFIEMQLRSLANEMRYDGVIEGKKYVPRVLELDVKKVSEALSKALNLRVPETKPISPNVSLPSIPSRPPTLCPGCGHRSTYYAIKMASKRLRLKAVYPNDIGCYTLGFFSPFHMADLSYSMGSSLGIGMGIAKVSDEVVISFIGDSTFFHAGLPALVNAVYNKYGMIIVVMDNSFTAMTGHQPHPGTGINAVGEKSPLIKIEDIARASGVEFIRVVDAYDVRGIMRTLEEAVSYVQRRSMPALIVARKPCALWEYRSKLRKGERILPYRIDQSKCTKCGICVDHFACPAIIRENEVITIVESLCVGCGVCADICPVKAIVPLK